VHETPEDLLRLQDMLDASYAHAGTHLRSIFTPERRMSARDVVDALRGVFLLHLATVTAAGEPFLAPIDGLFYRGYVWFSVPPGAARAHHLRARPQVSAAYTVGEDLCVLVHGTAREVDTADPAHAGFLAHCRDVYGPAFDYWRERYRERAGAGVTAWIEPRRMFASNRTKSPES
jgi:nitroimidazol reductase NimA-like FMN-containing flavoprotein (pyridoxamine 5'-phosphate oxidase superfamily)